VTRNKFNDKITVVHVTEESSLVDALRHSDSLHDSEHRQRDSEGRMTLDFCMCNPPFYGSNLEAWGWLTTRPDQERTRHEPSSISTASPIESIAPGGEVQFVRQRIIESSIELKTRIRVYSTMLGKKSSVSTLKEILQMHGVTNIGTTEFCQGKTMRWGLAWSFDDKVHFPRPISKVVKAQKPKPPLTYLLPAKFNDLKSVATKLEALFDELQVKHTVSRLPLDDGVEQRWRIESSSNTWTHQRRKRRQQIHRQQQQQSETGDGRNDGLTTDTGVEQTGGGGDSSVPMASGSVNQPVSVEFGEMSRTDAENETVKELSASKCCADGDVSIGAVKRTGDDILEGNVVKCQRTDSDDAVNISDKDVTTQDQMEESLVTNINGSKTKVVLCCDVALGSQTVENIDESKGKVSSPRGRKGKEGATSRGGNVKGEVSAGKQEGGREDRGVTEQLGGDGQVEAGELGKASGERTMGTGGERLVMELHWVNGENIEVMHQLLQYFRNKLI
jgi:hypothetical protein